MGRGQHQGRLGAQGELRTLEAVGPKGCRREEALGKGGPGAEREVEPPSLPLVGLAMEGEEQTIV